LNKFISQSKRAAGTMCLALLNPVPSKGIIIQVFPIHELTDNPIYYHWIEPLSFKIVPYFVCTPRSIAKESKRHLPSSIECVIRSYLFNFIARQLLADFQSGPKRQTNTKRILAVDVNVKPILVSLLRLKICNRLQSQSSISRLGL